MTPIVQWIEAELTPAAGRAGYLVVAIGVLVGSIIPIVPTGAVVGAAAAVAMTTSALSLPLVLMIAVAAALTGDLVTFALARRGSDVVMGRLTRGQTPERLDRMRALFASRGWLLVMVGRIVPAGRIPVIVSAAAMGLAWRRLIPATAVGAVLWALLYGVLGVVAGHVFDSPLAAAAMATVLVLLVGGVSALVGRLRSRRTAAPAEPVVGTPHP